MKSTFSTALTATNWNRTGPGAGSLEGISIRELGTGPVGPLFRPKTPLLSNTHIFGANFADLDDGYGQAEAAATRRNTATAGSRMLPEKVRPAPMPSRWTRFHRFKNTDVEPKSTKSGSQTS